MSDPFENLTGIKDEVLISKETALTSELENDIYRFLNTFTNSQGNYPYIESLGRLITNFQESGYLSYLVNFKELPENLQDFLHGDEVYEGFIQAAENVVKFMLYDYHRDFVEEFVKNPKSFQSVKNHIPQIKIRIKNFDYDLSIQDISEAKTVKAVKSIFSSKLQTIKGVVIAASHVVSTVSMMSVRCNNCDYFYIIDFNKSGELASLSKRKCSQCDEGILNVIETKVDGTQILTLQDLNDTNSFSTSTPVSLQCVLDREFTNQIQIGDFVIATGIIRLDLGNKISKQQFTDKVKNNDYYNLMSQFRPTTGSGPSFPQLFEINYIETNRIDDFSNFEDKFEKIKELQKRPDLYELLIKSFCPKIYGHEAEKEGILLALVGGVGRNTTNGQIDKRGNIHVMFIADPSTGKSELLKYTAKLMNRGLFVSATGSSAVGLTSSVKADKESGNYMVEAGGILKANGSVMCIDEIGRLNEEAQAALYEVAEQETYTLAKAGIVKTFDVNITLIVGGNPRDGRFNPSATASQNLEHLKAPFLSRFDAKFLLRDIPDKEKDKNIMRHVLKQTNGEFDTSGLIDFDLLGSYLTYVRNFGCQPKFTHEAIEYLVDYYSSQREHYNADDPTSPAPLAVREGEGIDRMCRARARLLNQEWVNVEDVKRIITSHEQMIYKIAYNERTKQVDMSLLNNEKTAEEKSKAIKIRELLYEELEKDRTGRLDSQMFINLAKSQGLGSKIEIDRVLKDLKGQNSIKYNEEYIELKEE